MSRTVVLFENVDVHETFVKPTRRPLFDLRRAQDRLQTGQERSQSDLGDAFDASIFHFF